MFFLAFVSGLVFFCCCFSYVFALLCGIVLPKAVWKAISFCQMRMLEEIFGSELLVLSLCIRFVVFVVVFPMFLLHYVALFSRKLSEKITSFQARFFEPLFGNKLLFLSLCVRLVFFGVVLTMILLVLWTVPD